MEIYHGSYTKILSPQILKGPFTKDFGDGFYCTEIRKQAQKWAKRYDTPIVNIYEYQPNNHLKTLYFKEMTDEWLDFVVNCRRGIEHDYDIIEGPMADDQIWNYVEAFIDGRIPRKAFWEIAKFNYPTHQIVFCTEEALKTLTFEGSDTL